MSASRRPDAQYSQTPASRHDLSAFERSTTSSDDRDHVRWKANNMTKRSPTPYSTSSKKQRLSLGEGEALFEVSDEYLLEKENDASLWVRCLDEAAEEAAPRRRQRGIMLRQSQVQAQEELQPQAQQALHFEEEEDEFPLDIDEEALVGAVEAVEAKPVQEYALAGLFEPSGRASHGCARMRVVKADGRDLELCELTEHGRTALVSLEASGFEEPRLQSGDIVHILALAPLIGEMSRNDDHDEDDVIESFLFFQKNNQPVRIDSESPLALIAHPDMLITPTTIADATHCDRMAVLRRMIGNGRRRNKALVMGQLKHECLRLALVRNDTDRDALVDEVIRRAAADVYAVDCATEARRECIHFLNVMLDDWARPSINTKEHILIKSQNGADRRVKLLAVDGAEEPRFAPILGVLGNVDLVFQLQEDYSQSSRRVPLELKTGSPHSSHAAQIGLYVAMDRTLLHNTPSTQSPQRDTQTPRRFGGLLLYPPGRRGERPDSITSPTMEHVSASIHETRSLLQARNRVADAMLRFRRAATESEAAFQTDPQLDQTIVSILPQVKQETSTCARCFQLKTCAAFHAATEAGNADSFGCGNEVWTKALPDKALTDDNDRSYLRDWMRALELEAACVTPASRQVLNRSASDRQSRGEACLGGLTVCQQSQDHVNQDASEWRYILSTSGDQDLAKCILTTGDFVMVSTELGEGRRRGVAMIDRGHIVNVNTKHIEISTTSRIEHRLPPGSTLRLDKDETTSSINAARSNVLALFVDVQNGGDSRKISDDERAAESARGEHRDRLRNLIVRLKAPQFQKSAQDTIVAPLLATDIGTTRTRFGGPGCTSKSLTTSWTRLNSEQQQAAERALSATDYALILGMPGTGKTSTIEFVLRCLLASGKRVLVCSHTHAAVDVVLAKLLESNVPKRCVGRLCASNSVMKVLPAVRDCVVNTDCSVQQLKAKLAALRVLGSTCLNAASDPILGRLENKVGGYFDVALLDEAGQISQPIILAPLYLARTFILVGDPHQLRPLCRSKLAASRYNADESLFERLATAHPDAVALLRTQYRMSKPIMDAANAALDGAFSEAADTTNEDSLRFNGWNTARRLKVGSDAVARATLDLNINVLPLEAPAWLRAVITDPFTFLDLPRSELSISQPPSGATNAHEVNLIVRTVEALRRAGAESSAIAILTPFRGQRDAIAAAFEERESTEALAISTIDKYQGSDRDVIIVSLVKNRLPLGDLLADPRRVNVALTRAKKKLILIGAAAFLGEHSPVFRRLAHFAKTANALHLVDLFPPPSTHSSVANLEM